MMKSKTISTLLIFLIVLATLVACKKEPYYTYSLIFENSTVDNFITKVYPKTDYPISYWWSYATGVDEDPREVTFKMDTFHREICLYNCSNPNNQPEELLSDVFDSILVFTVLEDDIIETLKFTPDSSIGYTENPYKDPEVWVYRYFRGNECTMICEPIENESYTFTIEKSKYR